MRKPHRRARRKNGKHPAAIDATPDLSPLDFVLDIMRDETKPDALRASMAKAAMPYLHQRADGDAPLEDEPEEEPKQRPKMSDLETARRIAHILMLGEKELAAQEPGNPVEKPANAGQSAALGAKST